MNATKIPIIAICLSRAQVTNECGSDSVLRPHDVLSSIVKAYDPPYIDSQTHISKTILLTG